MFTCRVNDMWNQLYLDIRVYFNRRKLFSIYFPKMHTKYSNCILRCFLSKEHSFFFILLCLFLQNSTNRWVNHNTILFPICHITLSSHITCIYFLLCPQTQMFLFMQTSLSYSEFFGEGLVLLSPWGK